MKAETAITLSAMAIAVGLVLLPRRAGGTPAAATFRNLMLPRVGAGDGAVVWDGAASARYREQLSREAGSDWYGP